MPTLYVENIPADLYDAIKLRAKSEGRSISSEVLRLLADAVPTTAELARRRRIFEVARRIRDKQTGGSQSSKTSAHQSAEEMLREDRSR
ncbi:MAG TPA: Arc family DNA-binding protein [Bryobacteraceae bacterium]|jgi:plasmid stability protein|nr:Arc family DNA-binding protein [Bryobacteraceae bacterium]